MERNFRRPKTDLKLGEDTTLGNIFYYILLGLYRSY